MRKALLFTFWAWPFLLFAGVVNALAAHVTLLIIDWQPPRIPVEDRFVAGLIIVIVVTLAMSPLYLAICHTAEETTE